MNPLKIASIIVRIFTSLIFMLPFLAGAIWHNNIYVRMGILCYGSLMTWWFVCSVLGQKEMKK